MWLTDNEMSHEEYIIHISDKYKDSCEWVGFWRQLD